MWILIGNVFDNLRGNQKQILVLTEVLMGICLILGGLFERDTFSEHRVFGMSIKNAYDILTLANTGAASSIIVITMV